MIAYVFPGQGSQQKGMGSTLFEEYNELTLKADNILGYSIKELCLEDPNQQLGFTQFTQPALFVVNALSYLKKVEETGKKPDFVAGHSLGEYNALFASGAVDFETGLRLVKKRGELMGQAFGGGMAAVVGMDSERVKVVLTENGLSGIDVANYNTPSQIVISGLKEDIERAKPVFEAAGVRTYIILKVSGAFHSRNMANAAKEFSSHIDSFMFSNLAIPTISNVTARPYKQTDIKTNLVKQITGSVKWTDSIRYLMAKGADEIVQVGPGNILAGMLKGIQREAEPLVLEDEVEDVVEEAPKELHEKVAQEVQEETVQEVPETVTKEIIEEVHAEINKEIQHESIIEKHEEDEVFVEVNSTRLGDAEFKSDYNLKHAYIAGGMAKGISSKEMVVKMGRAGMLGFFGTSGLSLTDIEDGIRYIQGKLKKGEPYGMNIIHTPNEPDREEKLVDLYLKYGIRNIEASAFLGITSSLVRYRLKGLVKGAGGEVSANNRIIAKASRPEVAQQFLEPAPEWIVNRLFEQGHISQQEADMSKKVPMTYDLCATADSGGHTDQGTAYVLMPSMMRLRDEMARKHRFTKRIRVGSSGGLGTPEAVGAAFVLGADFILTGSINQCTAESNTSEAVKAMLQDINVQDTAYVPDGDMFEIGEKVQVLKKGIFFHVRANKLYELYSRHNSIDEIDSETKKRIQDKYFKRSFESVYQEVKKELPYYEIEKADSSSKYKMGLIFKWYFRNCTTLAMNGDKENKVSYQIYCGPALGAFNQWVSGTPLENWRNRHVDEIAIKLMTEAEGFLGRRHKEMDI